MYSYIHDPETGGLLLTNTPSSFSKEPRPVYASELDLLGFDELWQYDKQNDVPYMWAESNTYWYRGKKVATITGGSLFEKPKIILEKDINSNEILPLNSNICKINISLMIEKNSKVLKAVEKYTKKRLYKYYISNKNLFNCCRISFSGGKDSIVLLDLVKQSIPHDNLIVLFGDTDMEFPDTYELIDLIKKQCSKDKIKFYIASSHIKAQESWQLFGPPSRILRWCCSVHKSVPMALKMKQIMGTNDFKELVFIGVRSSESEARSKYSFAIKNKKIKGQVTYNAILDWNSAEIWLYTYWKNLIINNAYKIGNQRVGCLYCPMSLKSDYIKYTYYKQQMSQFINLVKQHYEDSDLTNGYWCARTNGMNLNYNDQKVIEKFDKNNYTIEIFDPKNTFLTWKKILPRFDLPYMFHRTDNGYKVIIPIEYFYKRRIQISLLKNVLYKSAYCIGCRLCEINCVHDCISFNNILSIDNCIHCQGCNKLDYGCLVYNSRRMPTIKGMNCMKKAVDQFATHAPKTEWMAKFFKQKDDFFTNHGLGPEQISRFKKFLKLSELIDSKGCTEFCEFISKKAWDSPISLSLILINLASCEQLKWYIKNLSLNVIYSRKDAYELMISQGYREIASNNVISAFKRIAEFPFGTILKFGTVTTKGKNLETLCRTKPVAPDPRVYLYGLYKFAEGCDGYYEFTLGRLMDFEIEADAVSPSEIFGLSRDETEQYLRGLAQNYQDYVLAFSTTHGMETLNLNPDKTSVDVLTLF